MRRKKSTQPEFVFQLPSSARVTREYFARYDAISERLDRHPGLVARVHRDLRKPLTRAERRGPQGQSCKFTSDTVLRILVVKILENASFRGVVVRIDDSPRLRAFTRIHNGSMMDFTTLNLLANAIGPKTWRSLNRLLAEAAVAEGAISGEKLRIDTTAVETNIHWPTDSGLLWDTYRVVARLIRRLRTLSPTLVSDRRLQDQRVKRLRTQIGRASRRRTVRAKEEKKRCYGRLIALVEGILDWAPTLCDRVRRDLHRHAASGIEQRTAERLAAEIEHHRRLGLQVVHQARRRILQGEKVRREEKLFSLFEPHTELLMRGRARKEIEFGHMVSIQQVGGSFITDYGVFARKPADNTLVDPAIESHQHLFGAPPEMFTADKGFWESVTKTRRLSERIGCVSIGKRGRRTQEEKANEQSRSFLAGQRFRAGVEGSISFLKVTLGLWRCMNKGLDHFVSTVGATVFAHNLLVLARGPG